MMRMRRAFAAAVGVLALQHAVCASLVSDEQENNIFQLGAPLSDLGEQFQRSMTSLMNMLSLNPFRADSRLHSMSIMLSPNTENQKSCQLNLVMGSALHPNGLSVSLKVEERLVTASYQREERNVAHDTERGDSSASRSLKTASATVLPERCIATKAVVESNLAGYIIEKREGDFAGLVVFPSLPLLEDLVAAGKLPDDVVDAVQHGDNERLDRLTEEQQCLVVGFTEAQCEKLHGRPRVAPEKPDAAAADSGSILIPLYDISPYHLL